jgi:peptide deformylase
MAILSILQYPDPRLKKVASPVDHVDESICSLVRDMAETLYHAPGIGLAATQVDVHKQVIVIDISPSRNQLKVFINPDIIESEGVADLEEGCLSVPGVFDRVKRAERIRVRALDIDGNPFELQSDGMLAVCIQHEMDHLKGKVFVELLSPLKRTRILGRIRKRERVSG